MKTDVRISHMEGRSSLGIAVRDRIACEAPSDGKYRRADKPPSRNLRFAVSAVALALLLAMRLTSGQAQTQGAAPAQAPAGSPAFSGSDQNLSSAQLETLVGRVALYPDDLLAVVLPASTQPLQIVQAQRLLEQRKSDPNVQPPKSWDPTVVALLNYPEVIAMMNADLTWTEQLGTSVISQQSGVMDAIQRFRKKVQAAGNLKSNDKQTVVVEKETIVVQSANPQVIYVPSYNPAVVIYAPPPGYAAPYYYYSAAYPYYYSPGAAFFTGVIYGAALGYALDWHHHDIFRGDVDVNINRHTNININRVDIDGRRPTPYNDGIARNRENVWRADPTSVNRTEAKLGGGPGATARPSVSSQQIQSGLAQRSGSSVRGTSPSAQNAAPGGRQATGSTRPATANVGTMSRGSGAFSGAGSGAATNHYSSRGNQSLGRGASVQAPAGGSGARQPSRSGGIRR